MTDNTIKSTDINKDKEVAKKAPAKKAAVKKAATPKIEKESSGQDYKVIIFDSGSAYTSNDIQFTREDYIKEVPTKIADHLLSLENFRLPDQIELEEYLANKEN